MFPIARNRALSAFVFLAVLGAAAAAYAFFTSTGVGTGTATVGSSSALTLHATIGGNLFPGGSQPVSFTVDNPASGAERVGTISLASISVDAGHSTCSTVITGGNPDFAMPAVLVNHTFASGNGQTATPGGTLTMNDTGVSQDACQGATLTLHLTNN